MSPSILQRSGSPHLHGQEREVYQPLVCDKLYPQSLHRFPPLCQFNILPLDRKTVWPLAERFEDASGYRARSSISSRSCQRNYSRSFVGCFMDQEGLLETYARAHFTDCQELNLEPRRRQSGARCVCQLASMSKQSNRLCANV